MPKQINRLYFYSFTNFHSTILKLNFFKGNPPSTPNKSKKGAITVLHLDGDKLPCHFCGLQHRVWTAGKRILCATFWLTWCHHPVKHRNGAQSLDSLTTRSLQKVQGCWQAFVLLIGSGLKKKRERERNKICHFIHCFGLSFLWEFACPEPSTTMVSSGSNDWLWCFCFPEDLLFR